MHQIWGSEFSKGGKRVRSLIDDKPDVIFKDPRHAVLVLAKSLQGPGENVLGRTGDCDHGDAAVGGGGRTRVVSAGCELVINSSRVGRGGSSWVSKREN